MSLERFVRGKLVVLPSQASVYEAARAMNENRIGAVLVGEHHQLEGIVTDRDLGLRLIELDLDPRDASVGLVMTPLAVTCDIGASTEDVLAAMRQFCCRRVPITRGGRPVGLVTLDDLVLEGAVTLESLRSVVEAQLQQPARLKPMGTHPTAPVSWPQLGQRHRGRADGAYHRLLRAVARHTPPAALDHAEVALHVVLPMLCQRMRPEDARRLIAQLPSKLHPELEARLDAPRKELDVEAIDAELRRRLGVSPTVSLALLETIGHALADELSPGALALLRGHLPGPMKELLVIEPHRAVR